MATDLRDCRRAIRDGAEITVWGRLPAPPADGRALLVVEGGLGCGGDLSLLLARPPADSASHLPAGQLIEVDGRWRASPRARSAAWAGQLRVERWRAAVDRDGASLARLRLGLTAAGVERLNRSFAGRHVPLANALVLARTEGMDPALRDAFARSGIVHLLSISGFHVGVVAGLLFALVRAARVPVGPAQVAALVGVWSYVLLLGAPDPAVRAALLLSLLAGARRAGRPLSAEGTLSAAYVAMAVLDPGAPGRAGFQLSFAGAAGLARLAPALDAFLRKLVPRAPRGARSALAAGTGATLATLPICAWHFESVSLVGIPGTIAAGPLVSLAIAGLLVVLAIGPLSEGMASFLVGGIDVVLGALVRVVEWFAAPDWAAVAIARSWVLAGAVGWAGAALLLARARGLGRGARHWVRAGGAITAVLLAPLLRTVVDQGTVAIEMLDVGQGDAVLIRSPARRWVLVDAGPRSEGWDAGARVVVPALRRRGVRRLEAMVLTHPHLDHVGGAAAVLRDIDVGVVIDPGRPFGTAGFVEALETAEAVGSAWVATERGALLTLDGMTLEVLHPTGLPVPADGDPNDVSVVLLVRYGAFRALLTGDAPRSVEEALALEGPVQLLKVGHHGSETSSSEALLAAIRPAVALVSVGRGNRFGHPHPSAVARLEAAGASVHRTDLEGELSVRGREDGSWTLSAERSPD